MPKMLTKEELAEHRYGVIERIIASELSYGEYKKVKKSVEAIISHIDALTERLEGMADELDRYEDCTMDASYDLGLEVGAAHAAEELRAFIRELKGCVGDGDGTLAGTECECWGECPAKEMQG